MLRRLVRSSIVTIRITGMACNRCLTASRTHTPCGVSVAFLASVSGIVPTVRVSIRPTPRGPIRPSVKTGGIMPVSYETVPGGRYITGGRIDPETEKRMGGCVRDGAGNILKEFDVDEENTGLPATLTLEPG